MWMRMKRWRQYLDTHEHELDKTMCWVRTRWAPSLPGPPRPRLSTNHSSLSTTLNPSTILNPSTSLSNSLPATVLSLLLLPPLPCITPLPPCPATTHPITRPLITHPPIIHPLITLTRRPRCQYTRPHTTRTPPPHSLSTPCLPTPLTRLLLFAVALCPPPLMLHFLEIEGN